MLGLNRGLAAEQDRFMIEALGFDHETLSTY
jgi:hypothetical protein